MNYEEIAARLDALIQPAASQELYVEWLVQDQLAVGMRADGAYSILLVGSGVVASFPRVSAALRSGAWSTPRGTMLEGSVLALGSGSAFRIAISAIVSELVRLGAATRSLAAVFADVEPFVDLILRRSTEADELVVGLFGELFVLHQVLCAMQQLGIRAKDPTRVWLGWQRKSRDFRIGGASVEVKTTQHPTSRHSIAALDQVDIHVDSTGQREALYLASVGIQKTLHGQSVRDLYDIVLELLRDTSTEADFARAQFASKFAQYGQEGSGLSFDTDALNSLSFRTSFSARLYDLADPNVKLLRSEDIERRYQHVAASSVTYAVDLPAQIPGSVGNPSIDLVGAFATLLSQQPSWMTDG